MALRLLDIFLSPPENLRGKKVEFTISDVVIKDNEAIVTFEELSTLQIRIGSKIETKSFTRKKRN